MGSVWGDYDNDGFEDLLLYRWGRPELFHNDGGKGFTRVSESASLPAWANVNAAVWLDFDRDGRLDFFLGGYYPERVNLWKLDDTKMMPESFEYAKNGGRKYLFRNLGGGRFEEVSEKVGPRLAALDARRGGRRLARQRLPGPLHRQRLRGLRAVRQRGRALPRGGQGDGRRLRAQERDERLGGRRAEPGPLLALRLEHLGGGHPSPGQQPLGPDRHGERPAEVREPRDRDGGRAREAGASGPSSATSTTTASSTSTWSTATCRPRRRRATGTTIRRSRAATSS